MSSSVCQGLQSCLDSRLVESRFLKLKLAPSKTNFPASIAPTEQPMAAPYNEEKNTSNNGCKRIGNQNIDIMGGWSFLQSLGANAAIDSTEHDKVYVHHPLVKRSSASTLNEKISLEMCTESLGSETGSEVSDDISLVSLETEVYCNPSKPSESLVTRKMSRSRSSSGGGSFPPPLTSISGSNNGVQVRSRREGGRLVLQAVIIPPCCHSYFHAERSEGRLRLSVLMDATSIFDGEDGGEEAVEEDEHGEVDYEEEESYRRAGDMEGNSRNVGGEIGKGKFPRPSSCKESRRGLKGLLHWDMYSYFIML